MTGIELDEMPSADTKLITSGDLPRRYEIKEEFFTFKNIYKIYDESGRHRYTVRSKKWLLQKKLVLEDANGNALLKIHRKGAHLLDQYHILSARDEDLDREIASIQQKMAFFKNSYNIYSIYGEFKLKGLDIFDHSFTLLNKDEKTIAIVNKKFFSLGDTYDVEIIDSNAGEEQGDHAFILALVLVLHTSLYCS